MATALDFSLQLAAIDQRGVVGMAHGRLRRGVCCQLAILTARERRERRKWRIAGQDQQMEVSPKAWHPGWIGERGLGIGKGGEWSPTGDPLAACTEVLARPLAGRGISCPGSRCS